MPGEKRLIASTIDKVADNIGAKRTVLALSVARLGDAVGNSILFVVIPLYVAKLPAPWFPIPETVLVGILLSLYGLTNALLQPVVGAWIDRVSRRKPFIQAGLVLMGIGTLAFLVAGRFSTLLFIRGLQGFGVALTIPASLALMASATEKRTRGGSMGVYTSMRMVGFAIGPLLGGFLHDHVSFNAAFYTGAAFIFLGLIFVQLWVHEKPDRSRAKAAGSFRILDRELLTSGIIGLAIATFLMASSFSMMSALEQQFNDRLGQGALGFGLAFSALMVSRLIAQVPLGWLSDRIGRKPLIIGGLILMGPATVLLGLAASTLELTGFRVFQGVASAAIAAPAFALAADLARSGGEGRQLSIVTTGFGLGIALGPLIAGVLGAFVFELPFIIGGALTMVGAWIVYRFVPETVHRGEAGAAKAQQKALPAKGD